jgi:hypothetical protein
MGVWICMSNGFTGNLTTLSNHNVIPNLHSSQFTTAQAKASQFVFTSRCLVTDSNNILLLTPLAAADCLITNYLTHDGNSLTTSIKLSVGRLNYCWLSPA